MSGALAERSRVVTPSARICPPRASGSAFGIVSSIIET